MMFVATYDDNGGHEYMAFAKTETEARGMLAAGYCKEVKQRTNCIVSVFRKRAVYYECACEKIPNNTCWVGGIGRKKMERVI